MTQHVILFLAANPLGSDRRALDEEVHAIQSELERGGHRDRFDLVTRWAARPLDLLRELRRLKPAIVHFSGHGTQGEPGRPPRGEPLRDIAAGVGHDDGKRSGLFFQGPDRRPQLVSSAAIQETFGAAGSSVRVVVLSACYTDVQAEALLTYVDCVVGMAGAIHDDAARTFAVGFYGGLGESASVAAAYRQGRAAISLEGLPDREKPQLRVRAGVRADQLVVTSASPEPAGAVEGDLSRPRFAAVAGTASSRRSGLSLTFLSGKYIGGEFPLREPNVVRVGRTSELEVVLSEEMVSRLHAQLLISNGVVTISDLDSTNGTYVNGRRIVRATRLDVGDRILIGTSIMRLIASTAPGPSLEEARRVAETIAKTSGQRTLGVIDDTPLPDLLQMFSTSSRTGVLVVHCGVDVGKVYLRKGALYFATINDDVTMDPRKALFGMLSWSSGTFEFEPDDEATVTVEILESTDALITEGLRQLDELRSLQKRLPPLGPSPSS